MPGSHCADGHIIATDDGNGTASSPARVVVRRADEYDRRLDRIYQFTQSPIGQIAGYKPVHAFGGEFLDPYRVSVRQLDETDVPSDARLGVTEDAGEDVAPGRASHPQRRHYLANLPPL